MGGTAQVAELASYRLLLLGVEALWSPDPYVTLANAGVLEPGDAAVGISYSGQSRLTIEFLEYARARAATTLAVTAVPGSPITRAADVVFAVFGPDVELSPGLQRFASRVSAMALMEALVAAGLGVALVPGSIVRLRRPGVVYRPVHDLMVDMGTWAVWRAGDESPVRERFLVAVRAVARARPRGGD
jgi:hypothetical protein